MGKREERNTQGPASKLVFPLTITYMYVTVLFRNQTHIPIALMTTGALPKHRQVIFQAQVDNRQYLHAAERSQLLCGLNYLASPSVLYSNVQEGLLDTNLPFVKL